jgi:hypothetical protein
MEILYWLRRAVRRLRRKSDPLHTSVVNDAPESPDPNEIYLLGVGQKPWAAVFRCPCGCRATISVNLLPEARPSWAVKRHLDSTVTLWPSVDRMVGCRSHFWIRRGVVEWPGAISDG